MLQEGHDGGPMELVASPAQAKQLRAQGYSLKLTGDVDELLEKRSGGPSTKDASVADFPSGDEGFHTYDEMTAEVHAGRRPTTPRSRSWRSIGQSFEGRDIPVLKISDNAATDEDEPEVLFTCNMHAREHLTIGDVPAHHPAVHRRLRHRPERHEHRRQPRDLRRPDARTRTASEFDISGGEYQGWRKNRQPNDDGSVGTDINRNFSYKWGCCGGSDGNPSGETYRGPAAVVGARGPRSRTS